MKLITKPKLPRWIIRSLPFGEEEDVLSGFIVPFVLFSLMGVGTIWYQFHEALFPIPGIVITASIFIIVAAIVWWLTVQIDVLHILRERLMFRYKNTEDDEEKLKIKNRLSDLCVRV